MKEHLGPFEFDQYQAPTKERAAAALHRAIRAYMAKHKVTYLQAFEALQAEKNQAVENYAAQITKKGR